jgi:hypothetical protein
MKIGDEIILKSFNGKQIKPKKFMKMKIIGY